MDVKVLIVEDNPITSQDLKEIIEENGMIVTDVVKTKQEAITSFQSNKPDILLVDINLKGGDDGVDLVTHFDQAQMIPVIFLTANSDKQTVERALKTNPSSYLTKPYDDRDVIIAIELAFKQHRQSTINSDLNNRPSFIFLKSGSRFEKVNIENIQYLQADGSYTKFITADKEYTLSDNLNNTTNKIRNPSFLRIHRSYVVNIESVTGLDNDYVFIGEKNLPISRSFKEDVNRILHKLS
ncbi:LytR/AlgR family response regulator transcription factor [Ekhidna sp.]|uniref:LytR/AlgR family response regulator transcription factor n=1 Tax=Ekhidna sp. TaxID=2608089 RepID=UPI003C7A6866